MLIDSHCHLHDTAFDADREAVVERAFAAGVTHLITIGTSIAESRQAIATAERYAGVWATVGIAPHDEAPFTDDTLKALRDMAQHPKVVALGECGLDYHYETLAPAQQRKIFEQQLALALDLDKPIIIHNRDADEDMLAMLQQSAIRNPQSAIRGVMHCFSSTLAVAQACWALNFLISLAGPLTYPKSRALPDVARALPLEALLIETDAPFLSPQQWRGKRNEPAYVRAVAEKMAELRGDTFDTIAQATTQNAAKIFRLHSP